MVTSSHPSYQYQIGGGLAPDAPSYIVRQADSDFYQALKAGHFCYVFNSRQMGKSSLRVHTMQTLVREGIACGYIDMNLIVTHDLTPDSFYATIIQILANEFDIPFKLSSWWQERELLSPLQRISEFVEEILLQEISENIIIFIDEIDSILNLKFSTDDFFAFMRGCYEQRVNKPAYQRLSFALLGVATPSVLIQDKQRAPFNLGYAIELNGFQEQEALPLAQGLVECSSNPQAVLKEILSWTGGQPFLTQKLCYLVVKSGEVISLKNEAKLVEELVQKQVIENWQDRDHPQHLKTIEDRILQSDYKARLLGLYQQILEQGEVTTDDSPEQRELRLSGLVVRQQEKLKVYNRIYQAIFDNNWLVKHLGTLQPYGEAMRQWLASEKREKSWLLRGKALKESLDWAIKNNRRYHLPDEEYLNACQQQENRRLTIGILFLILCGLFAGSIALWKAAEWLIQENELSKRISLGEKNLTPLNLNDNVNKEDGVKAFANKNFQEAINQLEIARNKNISDPEVLIYLNNSKINTVNTAPAYTIAVSVPLDKNLNVAQEILRGVAQAQDQVNRQGGIRGINGKHLLKVKIASDDNDEQIARQVANKFVQDSAIKAVVGHNNSRTSIAAAHIYNEGELVMISPTASATNLSQIGKYIFRTVTDNSFIADALANYVVHIQKFNLVVCEDSQAFKDKSYRDEFQSALDKYTKNTGKLSSIKCDLSDSKLKPNSVIQNAVKERADGFFLIPDINRIEKAIEVAKANKENNKGKLKLFSIPTLYTKRTLELGGSAITGMVLAVPWMPASAPNFSAKASKDWGDLITWRTATAYDATMAIVEGLKQSDGTRKGLQKALFDPNFEFKGATGRVSFLPTTGNRRFGKSFLVEVKKSGTGYDFVPLNIN